VKSSLPGSSGRLIALLGIFAVIPLILLVALPLQMASASLDKQATERVADTAAVSANAISLQMQSLAGLTQSFSTRPELFAKSSLPASTTGNPTFDTLGQLRVANPNIKSAFLLDAGGHLVGVNPSTRSANGTDLSYRDYFTGAVKSNAPYIGEAIVGNYAPNPKLVTVSCAIHNGSTLQGVLVVSVDVSDVFQSYVDAFKQQSGVSTSIIDQHNGVVAAPGLKTSVPTTVDPRILEARNGTSSSAKETSNHQHVIVAFSPIAHTQWVLSTSVPQKDAFAPVSRFRTRVFIIALVLGTVIFVAFGLLIRSVRGRERADRDVRLSEERTRKVIETVRQGFFELDTNMCITDWNTQAEVMLGWSREEVWGRNFVDLFVPVDRRDMAIRNIKDVIDEPDVAMKRVIVSSHMISKSEQAVPVEINMWATDVAGRRRINIFAQDITERVKLEREQELVVKRQRRLVEELRTADKAKTDFISTISHELRTPLTSIVGYLEMLDDGYGGELSPNQASMLDVIDRNSRRLLNLIEDVLTLSRIESGAFKGRAVAVEVSSLVQGAVQTFVPTARNKSLELVVDVPKEVGWIRGDQSQLERVLLNVISNAIKFTPENGRVSVHGFRHDEHVTITVSDTGIGIPLEEQHRLFARFFRASTAQDHAIQGTGLGLTIVKSIVERHGGAINIQSAEGAGTSVILEFPSVNTAMADK
jgi:PAS domain S-box-containing protein